MGRTIDYRFRDLVGIRLVDADDEDIRSLSIRLGLTECAQHDEPDIVLRFRTRIDVPELNYLGLNCAGFNDDAFFVLDPHSGIVDEQIPFDRIGEGCDIVCRRGLSSIPLLADLLSLVLQRKGYIALHGSAFSVGGKGILVVGWVQGCKTEALLSFVTRGAHFVGDEIIILSADGKTMFGIPIPVAIWEWQFPYLEDLLPRRRLGQRLVFRSIRALDSVHRRFGQGRFANSLPFTILRKALPTLKRQLRNWYWPHELFAGRLREGQVPVDMVFHVASRRNPAIVVEPCEPREVGDRMRSSNEFERSHLYQYYRAFKYAFPQRRNPFLEALDDRQAQSVREALAGKAAYRVLHPYPVSLDALHESMQPYVAAEQA